ncbi:SDR family NAD(P)-dependent oxidoreductase [Neisseria zalophi]|uniref:SDR family NAD(P)-dependent oxidoreductase n=1 Tax=Neisseria zalophi TaxID=640030 RepID=A0A5J6PTF9_9NEIS|nr:SDR family NAD(P)-dependent oxidoreductase [Neisseria zalophi]QEY25939.1 SDR family NAD(P)-dependent oxidoreductase [Neisseria zalophi]
MMNKKVIISGYSSGLGFALAEYYLKQGYAVLGLARRQAEPQPSENLKQYRIDLSDGDAVAKLLSDGLLKDFVADAKEIILINNAGTTMPNAVAGKQNPAEIATAVSLNIATPFLLSNHLISIKPSETLLKIIHISSGAGRENYAGWSVYGGTKAALDHHARCIVAEQHPGVAIASIAPGVVDTPMQDLLRAAKAEDFPMLQNLRALEEKGLLSSPSETAARIAKIIDDKDFGKITIDDVRRFDNA